jgi:hypothetical protein
MFNVYLSVDESLYNYRRVHPEVNRSQFLYKLFFEKSTEEPILSSRLTVIKLDEQKSDIMEVLVENEAGMDGQHYYVEDSKADGWISSNDDSHLGEAKYGSLGGLSEDDLSFDRSLSREGNFNDSNSIEGPNCRTSLGELTTIPPAVVHNMLFLSREEDGTTTVLIRNNPRFDIQTKLYYIQRNYKPVNVLMFSYVYFVPAG